MKIERVLHNIGLSKNKGAVYLAVLEKGMGTAQEIAKLVGLPRTTVHEILQHLFSLGVVSMTNRKRAQIYVAEHPSTLERVLDEKKKAVAAVLPDLIARLHTKGTRPRIRIYEGIDGVKTIFEDTLAVRTKLLRSVLSMEDLFKIPGREYMMGYVRRRIAAGVRLRVIRSEQKEVEEVWPTSEKELRELHYAPHGMIFPMTTYLYDDKVSIIGTERENFGMMIESKEFYQTMENLFELCWKMTPVAQ